MALLVGQDTYVELPTQATSPSLATSLLGTCKSIATEAGPIYYSNKFSLSPTREDASGDDRVPPRYITMRKHHPILKKIRHLRLKIYYSDYMAASHPLLKYLFILSHLLGKTTPENNIVNSNCRASKLPILGPSEQYLTNLEIEFRCYAPTGSYNASTTSLIVGAFMSPFSGIRSLEQLTLVRVAGINGVFNEQQQLDVHGPWVGGEIQKKADGGPGEKGS